MPKLAGKPKPKPKPQTQTQVGKPQHNMSLQEEFQQCILAQFNIFHTILKQTLNSACSQDEITTLIERLIEKDLALKKIMTEIHNHQITQQNIIAIQQQIEQKEKEIHIQSDALFQCHSQLQETIYETKSVLSHAQQATKLPIKDLVSYGYRISSVMSAPPGYEQGKTELRKRKPPYPRPEEWNFSLLYDDQLAEYKKSLEQPEETPTKVIDTNELSTIDIALDQKRKVQKVKLFTMDDSDSSDDSR